MRALQALVIGMGILIVLGLGLLVFGMYKKATDPTWRLFGNKEAEQEQSPPLPKAQAFGDVSLDLPAAHRIKSVSSDGRRLLITVESNDEIYIIVMDALSGDELGRIQPR